MIEIKGVDFVDGKLKFIDQTKLPFEERYVITDDYERIAEAIKHLEIRGAPAIGVAAAFALSFSLKYAGQNPDQQINKAYERLASTRPTAVNLFWALKKIMNIYQNDPDKKKSYDKLIRHSINILEEDAVKCQKIAANGLEIFKKKSKVLTHCNTGALVTAGSGTALNIIKEAYNNDLIEHVYAGETRPLLQGSRLTAYELYNADIPFEIITDSAAAYLMKRNKIDLIITGADRIARNGDTANKIGTYSLAVLAKFHKIPLYIAAPTSTIDYGLETGMKIEIEIRDKKEVTQLNDIPVTRGEYPVYSPAFDITPADLITAIITEHKVHKPPFNF